MQLNLGVPTAVRIAPVPAALRVDTILLDLNSGNIAITLDDGGLAPFQQVTFTLPGATLAGVQAFIKAQLAARLGTTVT